MVGMQESWQRARQKEKGIFSQGTRTVPHRAPLVLRCPCNFLMGEPGPGKSGRKSKGISRERASFFWEGGAVRRGAKSRRKEGQAKLHDLKLKGKVGLVGLSALQV